MHFLERFLRNTLQQQRDRASSAFPSRAGEQSELEASQRALAEVLALDRVAIAARGMQLEGEASGELEDQLERLELVRTGAAVEAGELELARETFSTVWAMLQTNDKGEACEIQVEDQPWGLEPDGDALSMAAVPRCLLAALACVAELAREACRKKHEGDIKGSVETLMLLEETSLLLETMRAELKKGGLLG